MCFANLSKHQKKYNMQTFNFYYLAWSTLGNKFCQTLEKCKHKNQFSLLFTKKTKAQTE
jgi:hypothetical protein